MLNRWWLPAVLGCAALALVSVVHAQEEPISQDVLLLREDTGLAERVVTVFDAEASQPLGKYWIGVSCEPVSESLRSQLDLESGLGLVVNEVMDDSPAKAAGILPYDVLVSVAVRSYGAAEMRPLKVITDLSETLRQTEQKPVSLLVIRKGQRQQIEVTPAERPQQELTRFEANFLDINVHKPPHNPEKVQELLQQLQAELGGGPQGMVRLHMTAPVVVAPPWAAVTAPGPMQEKPQYLVAQIEKSGLPEGMTLTITKTGNNPARIEVKQGEGNVWGANENEIDTLPEEARALAKSAVTALSQPGPSFVKSWRVAPPPVPVPAVAPKAPIPPAHREIVREVERKVQHLELEALQQQIKELTAAQAKQAEIQQRQLRELQQALEKLTPKE